MTTGSRPSLARKHTRSSEDKRTAQLDTGLRITVEGDVFEVRIGDVTPELARELRALTGMSFMRLLSLCGEDPDVDVLTAFEWLARRVRGEDVELSQIQFTYADLMSDEFDIAEAGAESEDEANNPEA